MMKGQWYQHRKILHRLRLDQPIRKLKHIFSTKLTVIGKSKRNSELRNLNSIIDTILG